MTESLRDELYSVRFPEPFAQKIREQTAALSSSLFDVDDEDQAARTVVDEHYAPWTRQWTSLAGGYRLVARRVADELLDGSFDFDYLFGHSCSHIASQRRRQ